MSAIDNTPTNLNYLSPLNFKFQIKKAPHVNFFIQRVNIPSISAPNIMAPNQFVNVPYAGEHLDFGELEITFKVDEELNNYMEIYNWIRALGKPEDFKEYLKIEEKPIYTGEGITSDISLSILSNIKVPSYEVVYTDAFPVRLSEVVFNTTDIDVNYLEASATFKYTMFSILSNQ